MAVTQLTGTQVKDSSVGIADLSATGSPSSTTFHRGDNVWAIPAAPDLALTVINPTVNETVTAGYSGHSVRSYKIASGTKLTLGLASRFRLL